MAFDRSAEMWSSSTSMKKDSNRRVPDDSCPLRTNCHVLHGYATSTPLKRQVLGR